MRAKANIQLQDKRIIKEYRRLTKRSFLRQECSREDEEAQVSKKRVHRVRRNSYRRMKNIATTWRRKNYSGFRDKLKLRRGEISGELAGPWKRGSNESFSLPYPIYSFLSPSCSFPVGSRRIFGSTAASFDARSRSNRTREPSWNNCESIEERVPVEMERNFLAPFANA